MDAGFDVFLRDDYLTCRFMHVASRVRLDN